MSAPNARAVWAVAANNVWRWAPPNVDRWTGQRWEPVPPLPAQLDGSLLRASGPNDVWLSDNAKVMRWNGSAWTDLTPSFIADLRFITALWVNAPDDAWIVVKELVLGDAGGFAPSLLSVYRWNGGQWSRADSPLDGMYDGDSQSRPRAALWASGPDDLWLTANNRLARWNGGAWNLTQLPGATDQYVSGMWGTSAGDIWAVGADSSVSRAWHFDGRSWTAGDVTAGGGFSLDRVWGSCPSNFWATGAQTGLLRYDGVQWSRVAAPTSPMGSGNSITGTGPDDLWLSGGGLVQHMRPGVCGDGVVQPVETCDLAGSPFCTACQINDCHACFSRVCVPAGGECPGLTGEALDRCQTLVACLSRMIGTCVLRGSGNTARSCYCDDDTCSTGANGQCAAQLEAVAGSHDPAEVLRQLADPNSTIGKAGALAVCFAHTTACDRSCFQ